MRPPQHIFELILERQRSGCQNVCKNVEKSITGSTFHWSARKTLILRKLRNSPTYCSRRLCVDWLKMRACVWIHGNACRWDGCWQPSPMEMRRRAWSFKHIVSSKFKRLLQRWAAWAGCMILAICANLGLSIRSGDVTSAFLQTNQSMKDEDLEVWATPELAVLFGASPDRPWLPLKVTKAFYGLVHAPRAWYEDVSNTLQQIGWFKLLSDGCVFILRDGEDIVGIAGIHVDDFLIRGNLGNPVFEAAMASLEQAYRWGKWEHGDFTFAGCHLKQRSDMSIQVDQNEYSEKWMDEIPIDPQRAKQLNSKATDKEISLLRGALGTGVAFFSMFSALSSWCGLTAERSALCDSLHTGGGQQVDQGDLSHPSASHVSQLESALEWVGNRCVGRCLKQ